MESLLIDFDKIIKPNNLDLLIKKITPILQTKLNLYVIIIAPKLNIQFFLGLSTKKEQNEYLNSLSFIQSIQNYTYGVFDKNKKIYEIFDSNGLFLPQILARLLKNFPSDILIWTSVDLQQENLTKIINHYIDAGFIAPYICKLSPSSHSLRSYSLGMLKENTSVVQTNAMNDVKYVLEEFLTKERTNCEVILQLGIQSISFLKKLTDEGKTVNNDNTVTQKEIAGGMNVNKVLGNLIHILEVNKDSIIIGEEEGVSVVKSLYNFHSHPREAYKKHNVKLAWPSAQDYIGFLLSSFEDDAICHMIISIEGVYIISLNNHWVSQKEQLDEDAGNFILQAYDFCYKHGQTVQWYIEEANKISYKGFPIFDIKFLSWSDSEKPFRVKFAKLKEGGSSDMQSPGNCFTKEEEIIQYRKLYNLPIKNKGPNSNFK
jgi:hypothetical protein